MNPRGTVRFKKICPFSQASLIFTLVHIVPSINLTASEAICEERFCTVHEKGGLPQIQPKSSLQAKNVPWPENGASAVVEGRRPGRDWCRWRTVPGTSYTGTGTHWQCLVPPCVPGDLECARFIASRASAILASSSSEAQRDRAAAYIIIPRTGPSPRAHRGSHYPPSFGDEIFHSCSQSLQRRILLSRMDQFILLAKIHQWRLSTKPIIYFFLILYGNGGLKG